MGLVRAQSAAPVLLLLRAPVRHTPAPVVPPPSDASVSAVLAPDADTRPPDTAHGATHSAHSLSHPATPPVPGPPGIAPAAAALHTPLPRLRAPSATPPPHWPPQTRPRRHCPLRAPAVPR